MIESKAEPFACPEQRGGAKGRENRGGNGMNQQDRRSESDQVIQENHRNIGDHHAESGTGYNLGNL